MQFFVILALALSMSMAALAEKVGRIDSEHNNKRCNDEGLPQDRCDKMRANAINRNCVTRAEYELLKRHNLCPACDWDFPGTQAYTGYCPPGCFARGTRILVKDLAQNSTRWEAIENVVADKSHFEVWSLNKGSTIDKPSLSSHPILQAVSGPEHLPMVTINAADGTSISVTTRHAMLLASGAMIAAEDIEVGIVLAKTNGITTIVASISRTPTSDDVFNLLLDADAPISHSIIAEGFVTGDQYWQGELDSLLGTVIASS